LGRATKAPIIIVFMWYCNKYGIVTNTLLDTQKFIEII
jgi:hypothetical protein